MSDDAKLCKFVSETVHALTAVLAAEARDGASPVVQFGVGVHRTPDVVRFRVWAGGPAGRNGKYVLFGNECSLYLIDALQTSEPLTAAIVRRLDGVGDELRREMESEPCEPSEP